MTSLFEMSKADKCHRIQAALEQQKALEQALAKLRVQAATDHSEAVAASLQQAETSALAVRSFLNFCIEDIPIASRPSAGSSVKAQQVFDTPELLEHILLDLPVRLLISAPLVNRTFASTCYNSQYIQRRLGLRPDPNASLTTTFYSPLEFWTFHCTINAGRSQGDSSISTKGTKYYISARFGSYARNDQWLPKLGTRVRTMLICQPPVNKIKAYLNCCCPPKERSWMGSATTRARRTTPETLRSQSGITVGDLYDAAERLAKEHALCPFAEGFQINEDGIVDVCVTFEAVVYLPETDPLVIEKRKEMEGGKTFEDDCAKGRIWRAKKDNYAAAKLSGELRDQRLIINGH